MKNVKTAAFCGVEGAYAAIAAGKMFPGAELVACTDFAGAYHAVESGKYDCAVLPLENSCAGEVGAVTDLIFSGSLYINRIYELSIEHCLIAKIGVDISEIRTVVSHPQALSQCAVYIRRRGFRAMEYSNTAAAAEYVRGLGESGFAAIASAETAKLLGMEILERGVNDEQGNTTRFAAFFREPEEAETDRFILAFTVPNRAGALARAINVIGAYGFNMRCLRSRPMRTLAWSYYFYAEAEGDINSANGRSMMRELSSVCAELKLSGAYCSANQEG